VCGGSILITLITLQAQSPTITKKEKEKEREREREIREMLPVVANIVFREDARIGEGFDFLPGPTW